MAENIADSPQDWEWPEDVKRRLAAQREGILRVAEQEAEENEASQRVVYSLLQKEKADE